MLGTILRGSTGARLRRDAHIAFVKDKQPMTVIVAITDKGRKALVQE